MRASPSPLPARVAAEIETPTLGSPVNSGGSDAGVPGSGDSFARAVAVQAARLRSAVWRGSERVRAASGKAQPNVLRWVLRPGACHPRRGAHITAAVAPGTVASKSCSALFTCHASSTHAVHSMGSNDLPPGIR